MPTGMMPKVLLKKTSKGTYGAARVIYRGIFFIVITFYFSYIRIILATMYKNDENSCNSQRKSDTINYKFHVNV